MHTQHTNHYMFLQAERQAGKEALNKAVEEEREQSQITNEELKVTL